MAGQTMRILPRTDFDVSGLGTSSSATVTVARKIDTSRWRECVILARLHAAASWPTSSTIKVFVLVDGYTDEDPAAMWNVPSGSPALITFTQGTDTAPSVKNAGLSAPFGPLAQVQITFTTTATASGPFKPSLSLDLNLKGE